MSSDAGPLSGETPRTHAVRRVVLAGVLGLLVLVVQSVFISIVSALRPEEFRQMPWLMAPTNHTGMLLGTVPLLLLLSHGRLATYGFAWPRRFSVWWSVGLACGISAASLGLGTLLPGQGLTFAQDYTLLQTILFVWIYASIAEEVLTRGLIQGYLAPLAARGLNIGRLRLSVPVIVGAFFFGAMHLALFTMGIDPSTVFQIVAFAIAVGLVAGYACERSGSLLPAILVHALANITGTLLALVFNVKG